MKRILHLPAFAAIIAVSCLSTSCKKDDKETRSELIVGTWTLNAYGQDDNSNGTLESSEYDPIPAGVSMVQTYRSDKTGMITTTNTSGGTSSSNITWDFRNDDKELVVTNTGNNTNSIAVVTRLNRNEFMGYDPAPAIRTIYLFTK